MNITDSLDPTARWTWTPPGQELLPECSRASCSCRYPVVGQFLRIGRLRDQAIEAESDQAYADKLIAALEQVVVSVTIGGVTTDGAKALLEVATPRVLIQWAVLIAHSAQRAEADRGKSQSPPHGVAERSARVAVAGVNGTGHA